MSSWFAFVSSVPVIRNNTAFLNTARLSRHPVQKTLRAAPLRTAFPCTSPNAGSDRFRLLASAATTQEGETKTFESLFDDEANAIVLTEDGDEVSLLRFVKDQNAVGNAVLFGWLRHYGCTLCLKQASNWREWLPELNSSGRLTVALIGNGPVSHALDFKDQVDWPAYIFSDPERHSYSALSFKKGLLSVLNPSSLVKVIRSFAEGNKQTLSRIPTDALQQGGVVLVDHNGCVSFLHSDEYAGDHVDKDTLFDEVRSAVSN